MKLSKKKMAILATVCALMLVMVFVLCSFAPPVLYPPSYQLRIFLDPLSTADVDNVFSIIQLQENCGSFNSFRFICALYVPSDNAIIAYFAAPLTNFNVYRQSSGGFYFTFSGGNVYSAYLGPNGFVCLDQVSSGVSGYQSELICYRSAKNSSLVLNNTFTSISSSVGQDALTDVKDYWVTAYELWQAEGSFSDGYQAGFSDGEAVGFESGYRDGYDEGIDYGYEVGYPVGYDSGLADGYESGYDKGYETGYDNGYYQGDIDGYESGYDEGYESGYDEGYSEGYDVGYETAERDTIVIYEEPVEIDVPGIISSISSIPDSILSGSFDFEFAGINIYGLLKLLIIVFIISAVIFFIIKRSA